MIDYPEEVYEENHKDTCVNVFHETTQQNVSKVQIKLLPSAKSDTF